MHEQRQWHVLYYEAQDGTCPIDQLFASRSKREQAKILTWIALLEEQGPQLPRPYADLLEDGIHELRIKLTGDQVRVLYFFCFKDFIILTHSFIKNTNEVPHGEIARAGKYRSDFLRRFNEKALRRIINENL